MTNVYLKNGEMCILHKQISENEFLVEKVYAYAPYHEDDDSELQVEGSGERIVVDDVFKSAPTEVLDTKYTELTNSVKRVDKELVDLYKQKRELVKEVESLRNTRTDLYNFIVNRSDLLTAERLVMITENFNIVERDVSKDFWATFEVNVHSGITRRKFGWLDEGRMYSQTLRSVLINPTDDEIKNAITFQYDIESNDYRKSSIKNVSDKYLTDALKKVKADKIAANYEAKLLSAKKDLEKAQNALIELEASR